MGVHGGVGSDGADGLSLVDRRPIPPERALRPGLHVDIVVETIGPTVGGALLLEMLLGQVAADEVPADRAVGAPAHILLVELQVGIGRGAVRAGGSRFGLLETDRVVSQGGGEALPERQRHAMPAQQVVGDLRAPRTECVAASPAEDEVLRMSPRRAHMPRTHRRWASGWT